MAIPATTLYDGHRMVPIMLDRRQAIQVLTFGTGGLLAGVCWQAGVSTPTRELPGAFVLIGWITMS